MLKILLVNSLSPNSNEPGKVTVHHWKSGLKPTLPTQTRGLWFRVSQSHNQVRYYTHLHPGVWSLLITVMNNTHLTLT